MRAADDERFMRRALELAERGRGLTSPNPMVGAVVVRDGVIVGEGYHHAAGEPHAEIEALRASGERSRGATLYVTLEPCTHQGRTPPCAPAVIEAGVARVVAAVADPNPLVAGRGLAALRVAGVAVAVGVMAGEATVQNRAFLTAMRLGRPHVVLKAGMTLDGRIADLRGRSRWITGETARRRAHEMRSESDAIVVGVETVLSDDPALTVRLDHPWPREPFRVVLDSRGRTPETARIIAAGTPARAIVALGAAAPEERRAALAARGATVVRCAGPDGRVDPAALLDHLHRREVRSVLLEGGGETHMTFLDAGLVDRVALFIAPLLIGGRAAVPLLGGAGRTLADAVRLEHVEVERVGADLLVQADVVPSADLDGASAPARREVSIP